MFRNEQKKILKRMPFVSVVRLKSTFLCVRFGQKNSTIIVLKLCIADYPCVTTFLNTKLNKHIFKNIITEPYANKIKIEEDIIALVTLLWYRCRSQYRMYVRNQCIVIGRYNEYIYLLLFILFFCFFYMNHFLKLKKRSLGLKKNF